METAPQTITDQQIDDDIADGKTNVQIAERIGVHPATIGRWRKPNQGTAEKQFAIAALRAEGVKTPAIAQALGLKEKTIYDIELKARKNGNNPLLLPRRIKSAVKVYDTFLQGKPIGRIEEIDPETGEKTVVEPGIYPKCSTIKACADAITDRAFPKVSDQSGPSISFTQINIGSPLPEAIDVTPITISGSEAHNRESIPIGVMDSSMISTKD